MNQSFANKLKSRYHAHVLYYESIESRSWSLSKNLVDRLMTWKWLTRMSYEYELEMS